MKSRWRRGRRRPAIGRCRFGGRPSSAIRTPAGLNQRGAAELIGVSASVLQVAVKGRREPSNDWLHAMGRAYGISVEGVASAWDRTWSARVTGTMRSGRRAKTTTLRLIAADTGLTSWWRRFKNRPLHTNPRDPVDQEGDGSSPVWAVSGDPLVVATVTVNYGTDRNRSGFRRNEKFTAH
ncbi:helix-turn-helix domain-containing protein [Rhodococcus sp. NM-2]|uniref:helix-turn-helix domain-containing protein n=1 Tax=Rhodococcus sp. NM-2 TaxID=3401174 RepID=UPI003AB093A9